MNSIHRSLIRVHLAAQGLVDGRSRRRERGDVPGWVLITLMTAGLVAAIWLVAEPQLKGLFERALNKVSGI